MAELGLLAMEFDRPTLDGVLDAIAAAGVKAVQFDLACAGGATFPETIDDALCKTLRQGFAARGLSLAAISGCFNMIHPDRQARADGLHGLCDLIPHCAAMGTSLVTLCTGTRDPDNMWRRHPGNDSAEAWTDLVATMREAIRTAEENNVTLAIEPEVSNVIDSAAKARRLIDEIGSPRLKVVMDGANIFHRGELPRMREMLDEAFDLLGADIALAHAKDLDHDGDAGHLPAGRGLLDYPYYLGLLQRSGFDGAVILHALREADTAAALALVVKSAPGEFLTQ
jgi:sugar phosphate isomerase/epimerase